MQSLIIAIVASCVLLAGLLVYRAVMFVISLRKRQKPLPPPLPPVVPPAVPVSTPPTLMRVGQVSPPTTVPPPVPQKSRGRTDAAETAVAAPSSAPASAPYSTARYVSDSSTEKTTKMFSVDQLRDRSAAAEHASIDPADTPMADDNDYAFGKAFTPFFAAALPETSERKQELKQDLVRAGYYQPHAFENIQAVRWLFLILPLILLCILINVLPRQVEFWVIGTGLCVALLGWALPKLYIAGQAADRRSEIERSLPDVLDMLNMCVSQGMTLINALKRVTQELGSVFPALSQELKIVAEQAELGTLEQALTNFSRRVDAPDVHSFTSLLIQTERMGTSVSAALGDYAENMRESLKQRADEKSNKATFQLLFPTVLFLMPSVYIFLLGPSIIKLTDFFSGNTPGFQQPRGQIQPNNR
ncbi:MAG: Type secretion system domain protein [Planctomycetaceae bacterium]|nr:Type secretion system domain protein [Planctomycetaceae bacterium]